MSWQLLALDIWLRWVEKPRLARETSLERARARMEAQAALLPMPGGAVFREVRLAGGIGALVMDPPPGRGLLLWLHGGAFVMGSPRTHAALAAALAIRAGLGAVLPAYRLAPEHPFPAAADDALAAYRALLAAGEAPGSIALGGDSAGGGLALGVVHAVLEAGLPPPGCVVALSPWLDLTLSGASLTRLSWRDATLPARRLPEARALYLAGAAADDPRASPVFGHYRGAPPVLLQASRAEILLDDSLALAERLRADGVAVELDLWRRPPHVWQIYQGRLPEADAALDRAAAFLRAHTADGPAARSRWP